MYLYIDQMSILANHELSVWASEHYTVYIYHRYLRNILPEWTRTLRFTFLCAVRVMSGLVLTEVQGFSKDSLRKVQTHVTTADGRQVIVERSRARECR